MEVVYFLKEQKVDSSYNLVTFERFLEIVKDLDGFRYTKIDGKDVEDTSYVKPLQSDDSEKGTKL